MIRFARKSNIAPPPESCEPALMNKALANACALFALLVMLAGTAHAVQHDMAHFDEAHIAHECLQADVSVDLTAPQAVLPPLFLTLAPHLPRNAAPHQAALYIYPARGPPLTL